MALVVSIIDEKARRSGSSSFRKQQPLWMLKDYLREEMSSCSSNGFRSFPRRQCCVVAVRNIIDTTDIIPRRSPKRISIRRSFSSAIQRAVISAAKLIPFKMPADPPVSSGDAKKSLARSFSKKLFKKSFWMMTKKKSECNEIERWISSGVVSTEKYQLSDLSNDTTVTNASTTTSNGKSDSWSDITFTSGFLPENDAVGRRDKIPAKDDADDEVVSRRSGVTFAAPVEPKNTWVNEMSKKEQLSPISTLDYPDIDEGGLSPFTLRISRLTDTQERLMEKLGRFESLAVLELEPLYNTTSTSEEDEEHEEEEREEEEESEEQKAETKVNNLLNMMKPKTKTTSYNLLFDFFRERVMDNNDDTLLLKEAENWVNGKNEKLILSWKVREAREAYVRDMEGGNWAISEAKLENDQVVLELGDEVLAHLIDELLQECFLIRKRSTFFKVKLD